MGSPIRLRKLARELRIEDEELARWVSQRFGVLAPHPADFVGEEIAGAARVQHPLPEPEPEPSANVSAARLLVEAFRRRDYSRLLIVGGTPSASKALRRLLEPAIELRIVDGDRTPDAKRASADLAWAHVVAVWSGTILDHKMSRVYAKPKDRHGQRFVTVPPTGAASLCRHIAGLLREDL